MKMPTAFENIMFAPCGMNCMVCYKHCNSKKPCEGCLQGDLGKPEHCKQCKIKNCVKEKNVTYCYECDAFPCKSIKNMEKSYNKRFHTSLIEYSIFVKDYGVDAFMQNQMERWTCGICGGVISLHDRECSECKAPIGESESNKV